MSMQSDLALASALADAAGAAIRPYFRGAFGLEDKDDASPVTLADRAAEEAMRRILECSGSQFDPEVVAAFSRNHAQMEELGRWDTIRVPGM